MKKSVIIVFLLALVAPFAAQGQSIEQALDLYKQKEYPDAAKALYTVVFEHPDPDTRDQAQIYLAESLFKMNFHNSALFYYNELFQVGRSNRYYLNAVEGLLKIQKALHDPLVIPTSLSTNFDGEGFNQLDPDKGAQISYLVGRLSYMCNQNSLAREYLEFVPPESLYYSKARYLLGLIDIRGNNAESALEYFQEVQNHVPEDSVFDEQRRVRNLSLLATGRALYGLGRYKESSDFFQQVPRFTQHWFNAMYENAWAWYKQEDYGRALGELHSTTAPYFDKTHIPETYVIQGTAYFVNCQWDRVRRSISLYNETYPKMRKDIEEYLANLPEPAQVYRDIAEGGNGKYPLEIAREIRKTKQFRDFHHMMEYSTWEASAVSNNERLNGSRLSNDLKAFIEDQRAALEPVIGGWVTGQLKNRLALLKNFQGQIDTLDLELSIAETRWLDERREISKGWRARLPRPAIPNDQWQHWEFHKEYWKGELGYYHHAVGNECDL
jgi:tetratricopeptide (TPR) repeat protein